MMSTDAIALPWVVNQHMLEAASVYLTRHSLLTAPRTKVQVLHRFDERLAAHLDGLAVAGDAAWNICDAALDAPSADAAFPTAVKATSERNIERLDRLLALGAEVPSILRGVIDAFAWVEARRLQGIVAALLASDDAQKRVVGIAACARHRVNPGADPAKHARDASTAVRATAWRAFGELGLIELSSQCADASTDEDPESAFWAAWSAVLMGKDGRALDVVANTAVEPGRHQPQALRLTLQAASSAVARATLGRVTEHAQALRWRLEGSGIIGDPMFVPWLVSHMAAPATSRLAGEAFTLITGTDLEQSGLDGARPADFESGPNEDPDDPNVEMDADDGLPWPDAQKIETWWAANGSRFQKGTRYFMGAPVTRNHCIDVLKRGYQRQRILAAQYLCLLDPGTPLFDTSAPAWRQQRLLATLS
jgi:uncharacterized protein (TIGR02270 family)